MISTQISWTDLHVLLVINSPCRWWLLLSHHNLKQTVWIQTVWCSESVPERIFCKSYFRLKLWKCSWKNLLQKLVPFDTLKVFLKEIFALTLGKCSWKHLFAKVSSFWHSESVPERIFLQKLVPFDTLWKCSWRNLLQKLVLKKVSRGQQSSEIFPAC